jgi:Calcineurin-like phosphoesterase
MSKTYVIADLHGRFDLLEMALACIAEHVEPPATLVTLGDYVDRGPDSRKVIERLMPGLARDVCRPLSFSSGIASADPSISSSEGVLGRRFCRTIESSFAEGSRPIRRSTLCE